MKKNEARVKWKLVLFIKASDPSSGYSTTDDIDSWVAAKIFLRRFVLVADRTADRRSEPHFSPLALGDDDDDDDNNFRVIGIVK